MTFRFLHIADLHLGAAFASRSKDLRDDLKQASRDALAAAVDAAIDRRLHALLIAGDLFDDDNLSLDLERFLAGELARLTEAGIPAVYVTGNHDPGSSGTRASKVAWPAALHLIHRHQPQTIGIRDRAGVVVGTVTGAGHESREDGTNLAGSLPRADSAIGMPRAPAASGHPPAAGTAGAAPNERAGTVPHVALVHAYVSGSQTVGPGQDRYAPCATGDFVGKGYAYWALGHIHKQQRVLDAPQAWYSGSPQGLDPTETGAKGGLLVEIDGEEATVQALPLGRLRWETAQLNDLGAVRDMESLRVAAKDALARQTGGVPDASWLVRLVPSGPCPIAETILEECADEALAANLSADLAVTLGVRAVEIRPKNLVALSDVNDLYERGPSPFRNAIDLIRQAAADGHLLNSLAPEVLAGAEALLASAAGADSGRAAASGSGNPRADYLRGLLDGLENEAAVRFAAPGDER